MAGIELIAKLEGFDDLAIKLSKSPDLLDKIETDMLKMAGMIVQAEAKSKAPVDRSILRKSITLNIKGNKGNRYAEVGTNVPYAIFQELGTGIYGPKETPITPKRAKMLVFEGKDGRLVFTKSVRGVKPKRFMKSGLDKLMIDMNKVIELGKKMLRNLLD